MYNRSLVLALFGLVYVDRSALQHLLILAYLVSWTCSFCVCLVCVCVCVFCCLKNFEELRVALTVGIISSRVGLHYHFRLSLHLSADLHFGFTRRKARRIFILEFFSFLFVEDGWIAIDFVRNGWFFRILRSGISFILNFALLCFSVWPLLSKQLLLIL